MRWPRCASASTGTGGSLASLDKVVVTGAAGYIGGQLIKALSAGGSTVHAVVREPAPRLEVAQTVCDISHEQSREPLRAACEGAQTVVHLAGENELMAARTPAAALASTVVATERLSEVCVEARIKRLVYMSTIHVYGARIRPGATLQERMRVEPRSAYAISRLASEHVAATLAGSLELVILRLTNSVGAPDHPSVERWSLVANDLCRQGALRGRLELHTPGTQWRDFVALGDVCAGIVRASASSEPAVSPGTYNFGSGRPTTVRQLAGMIQDAFQQQTGTRPRLLAPKPTAEAPSPYSVSVQLAAEQGLEARTDLREAVAETVGFCLEHREELA